MSTNNEARNAVGSGPSKDEIRAHLERASTGRIRYWSGPPGMVAYGAQSVRRWEALAGFVLSYVRKHGNLPLGTHLATVTFGPEPSADVWKPADLSGRLVIVIKFYPPGVKEPTEPRETAVAPPSTTASAAEPQPVEDDYNVLLSGERSSMVSAWTEYLCLSTSRDAVTLTSRGYQILGDASKYEVELDDGTVEHRLPAEIDGDEVKGIEDGYVVGGPLVEHDDEATCTVDNADLNTARTWLEGRGWHREPGFRAAWEQIEAALVTPEVRASIQPGASAEPLGLPARALRD